MPVVHIAFGRQIDSWVLRCPELRWRYAGEDLAEAVRQLDQLVDPDAPLEIRPDLGQDTDWYLQLAAHYRDKPHQRDEYLSSLDDCVFAFGLHGAPRDAVLRLLRADTGDTQLHV